MLWKVVVVGINLSCYYVMMYAEVLDGSCDFVDGVCQKSSVDEDLEVEYVSSKVREFQNEAVGKAIEVLQALGFTRAEQKGAGERGGRIFDPFGWAAQAALGVLNLFGYGGAELSNIPVVAFPIPVCNISDYEPCQGGEGLCTSPSSCSRNGGKTIGKCGTCLGCTTCCQYTFSCRESTDKLISYFQSPSYPNTDRTNDGCSLTITILKEVSQIRLDFLDFEMPAPLGGVCADRLQIINTAQPGGVFGPGNNDLCGLNSGQHIYLPVSPGNLLILRAVTSGVLNVPLSAVSGRSRGLSGDSQFRWNIKITQIPSTKRSLVRGVQFQCNMVPKYFQDLAAPEGCAQYHTKSRGSIESFNFDGSSEINLNYDYTICVKRLLDTCGITMKAIKFSIPATTNCLPGNVNVDTAAKATGGLCCTVEGPVPPLGPVAGINYFGFPGSSDGTPQTALVPNAGRFNNGQNQYSALAQLQRYYYCGQAFGNPNTNLVVARVKGPLVVKVRITGAYWGPNQFAVTPISTFCPSGGCVGFSLMYDVDAGSC